MKFFLLSILFLSLTIYGQQVIKMDSINILRLPDNYGSNEIQFYQQKGNTVKNVFPDFFGSPPAPFESGKVKRQDSLIFDISTDDNQYNEKTLVFNDYDKILEVNKIAAMSLQLVSQKLKNRCWKLNTQDMDSDIEALKKYPNLVTMRPDPPKVLPSHSDITYSGYEEPTPVILRQLNEQLFMIEMYVYSHQDYHWHIANTTFFTYYIIDLGKLHHIAVLVGKDGSAGYIIPTSKRMMIIPFIFILQSNSACATLYCE